LKPQIGIYGELRGRPRRKSNSQYDHLKSIVKIACKHDVDPKQLVDALVDAWQNTKSRCGRLKIALRIVNRDSATFLITKEENVVWQSKIYLESMRDPEVLKDHIHDIPLPQHVERESYPKNQQIDTLRVGMKGINVTAKVIEVPPIQQVFTRWGSEAYVTNAMIADETGSIRLSLWNSRVDTVQVGDEVELTSCYVSRFAGEPQLRLRRKSTLAVINSFQQEALTQHSL